jgi:hypothetical protein
MTTALVSSEGSGVFRVCVQRKNMGRPKSVAQIPPLRSPLFPASPLSLGTAYVVLPKENPMHSTEDVTLDRKSAEAGGSAVLLSAFPNS